MTEIIDSVRESWETTWQRTWVITGWNNDQPNINITQPGPDQEK